MDLKALAEPGGAPFALLHRRTPGRDHSTVEVLRGPVHEVEHLADLPCGARPALALVPFRQIRERGFEVHDDGTPLLVLTPETDADHWEVPVTRVLAELPSHTPAVHDGAFDITDEEYAGTVRRVIEEEIGTGQGANFVVRRTFRGEIPGFGPADALALFRRLLAEERGAYWTYVVHTGERTLVGASPEAHVRMSGGTVTMNPISGTYRYPADGPTTEGLLSFLGDAKEQEELSMVVDEELKMMCTVGDLGGVVIGPRLKEMSRLAHTEYELRGRSGLDVREVLRETMFAATVTGSPLENACRVIRRHEPLGPGGRARGYYAGALALIGTDAGGAQTLDSPILIRTADIAADGSLEVAVGATLVRGSDPAGEVAETHAKAAGVLSALGVAAPLPATSVPGGALSADPRVRAALDARRERLAPFWLRMREPAASALPGAEVAGHALVVDCEDTFTAMLAHLLRAVGLTVTVRRHDAPDLAGEVARHEGPLVLGPGPGDPRDGADPRMRTLRETAARALAGHGYPVLGVCLGHELIAAELGLELVRKQLPFQGAQLTVDLLGSRETVGFYNSFTARCSDQDAERLAARGVEVFRDRGTGEVHALRGPGFAGVQFHPESVLTLRGPQLLRELLTGAGRAHDGPRAAGLPAGRG